MDIERYLILLKGEDKTDVVKSYENIENWRVRVTFCNKEKAYTYSKKNFQFYSNPVEINIDSNSKTLIDGDIFNVKKILKFDSYCRIIFNNETFKTVPIGNLKLTEKKGTVSEDRFNYFKDISKIVSVRTEDGVALLTKEYDKVNFVEKDTALYKYLNPNYSNRLEKKMETPLIFPFGSNKSQYEAVRNAIDNQISIIEGPPGTGKTQTILNIIANIIVRGKTVAIVSNNNEATANVFEKLDDKGYGFICATLGKKENKEKFIENQKEEYPVIEEKPRTEISEIVELNNKLDTAFSLQNQRAIAKALLEDIEVQYKYFNKNEIISSYFKIKNIEKINPQNITKRIIQLEEIERKEEKISLWFKIREIFFYGIGSFKFFNLPIHEIIQAYNKLFYLSKRQELLRIINSTNNKLNYLRTEETLKKLKEKSNNYLSYYLKEKYVRKREKEKIFNK